MRYRSVMKYVLSALSIAAVGALAASGPDRGFEFEPLESTAPACADPDAPGYAPFVLPAGFSQEIVATEFDDFHFDLPDMLTLNEGGASPGRWLYRTHETLTNGSVTVTDLDTGRTRTLVQRFDLELLDGMVWTPWNTLLFAEEATSTKGPLIPDPDFPAATEGLVYEYFPDDGRIEVRPAIGARSHEGLRFDPAGNLYGISETEPGCVGPGCGSGAIYKFVPDRRGDLSSGRLYALHVRGDDKVGEAEWLPLDREASAIDSDAEARRVGATGYGRPEDIEILPGSNGDPTAIFVSITSENRVLRIEDHGPVALVSDYVRAGVNVAAEGEDPAGTGDGNEFDDPDNLELDIDGNLYIAEDEGPGDIWVARGTGGKPQARSVVRFAALRDCDAEPTGIYFDLEDRALYVNVQHAGGLGNDLTVVIRPEE